MMKVANAQLWVHDQEAALEFYTKKVGMEVRADVTVPEMGNFRWLAVGTVFLTTEDCQASYDELSARGVEFTGKPERVPYGIDCAFRDPSGNNIRLAQLMP